MILACFYGFTDFESKSCLDSEFDFTYSLLHKSHFFFWLKFLKPEKFNPEQIYEYL